MRKLILVVAFALCSYGQLYADFDTTIDNLKYRITNGEAWVLGPAISKDSVNEIQIPSQIDYNGVLLPVSVIYNSAFMNCSSMKKIEIPETIKKIFSDAFYKCI